MHCGFNIKHGVIVFFVQLPHQLRFMVEVGVGVDMDVFHALPLDEVPALRDVDGAVVPVLPFGGWGALGSIAFLQFGTW